MHARRLAPLLALLAAAAPAAPLLGQPVPAVARAEAQAPAFARRLDAAIDKAIAEQRIVGAVVLVAEDGRIVYRRTAGHFDREKGEPMREDAIFRLASVSKAVMSVLAMTLVEDSTLALDAPVSRWLPEFRPRLPDGTAPEITVRQLLSHTAGLSYGFLESPDSLYFRLNVLDGMELPDTDLYGNLQRLAQIPLAFPPGTGFRYSLATDVLGAVIERATGKPLAQVVREKVTAPLGMTDTGFAVTDPARLAPPYIHRAPGTEPMAPERMTDNVRLPMVASHITFAPSRALNPDAYPSGGAGMVGTARDILALLEAVRTGGGTVLKPETVAKMMVDHSDAANRPDAHGWGFGLGWSVLLDPAAAATPHARGTFRWGGVYGHSWFVDPERKLTVVALTNTTPEGMDGPFVDGLRSAIYGVAPESR